MLAIRLQRKGTKQRPFYRIVVSDGRQVPTGRCLESIGFYDPKKDPPDVELNLERLEHWVGMGAKPSTTVKNLIVRVKRSGGAA